MSSHYNGVMTPGYPYTPTPTTTLPYNTPESSAQDTFHHLSKDIKKTKKRLDFTNGFPYIEPVESDKKQLIDIITESPSGSQTNNHHHIIPPQDDETDETDEEENDFDDDNKQHPQEYESLNLDNLKINITNIPETTENTNTKHFKKHTHSKTFSLIEGNLQLNIKDIGNNEDITLNYHGYSKQNFIADTLQGSVYTAKQIKTGEILVVKTGNKSLHSKGVTIQKKSGKRYKIEEDIVQEAKLMKLFMESKHPSSMIQYYDFFQDEENYYLVMENGGNDMFDFVVSCHDLILCGKLSIREWRRHVKFMFAQMVLFINWMHEEHHCANLDVSLENLLITDDITVSENGDEFKSNQCYIKFVDFGLSELFDPMMNPCFLCNKFVGKQRYKAPEVYSKVGTFCANKADVWSMGISLFMMAVGAPPFDKPVDSDIAYEYVKCGRINDLLQSWNRLNYVTANLLDLLTQMLCENPAQRIGVNEIMKHPWIKIYFQK